MIVGKVRLTRFESILEPEPQQEPIFQPTSEYVKTIVCENSMHLQQLVKAKNEEGKQNAEKRGFYYEWVATNWNEINLTESFTNSYNEVVKYLSI